MKRFMFFRKKPGYSCWVKAVAILLNIFLILSLMPVQTAQAVDPGYLVIQGTVQDDLGAPLLGCTIRYHFESPDGSQFSETQTTSSDVNGLWSFPDVYVRTYFDNNWKLIVEAFKSGGGGYVSGEYFYNPGTTLNLGFTVVTHGTLNVHITDLAGNPAPAGVPYWFSYCLPDQGGYDWPWNAPFDGVTPEHFTNGSGTITFVAYYTSFNNGMAFPAGTQQYGGLNQTGNMRYEVSNSPVGLDFELGQTTDLTIAVRPLGKITALAKDADTGQPVTSADFDYVSVSPGMNKYASVNDGTLIIYADGDLDVTASGESNPALGVFGYDSASATVTSLPWGEVTVNLEMERHQPGTILGRVTDGDENPFPGATVELIWSEFISDFGEQLTTIMQTTSAADGSYSFTGVIPSGSGAYLVRASEANYIPDEDNEVNVYSGQTTYVSDLELTQDEEPPAWYDSMELWVYPGRTGIVLQWRAAEDNVAVTEYRVYQGETLLGTAPGENRSYPVTGLTPETQYTFRIEAVDAAGNISAAGPSGTGTTLPSYQSDQTIQRVSVSSDGLQANDDSDTPDVSFDGRYTVFSSDADNLVSNDNNWRSDIFVFDRETGETKRVSISSEGVEGNGSSRNQAISADGRYMAFESSADNLVAGDNNQSDDIFLHDVQTGITGRISVSAEGAEGDSDSYTPSISADGRYIAFASYAENLVAGDSNSNEDIFVYDRLTGEVEIVSISSDGAQGNSYSAGPAISADGSSVAFYSNAGNLVNNDSNSIRDIFVHDRTAHTTELISVSTGGVAGDGISYYPAISADGRYVAFESRASNLVSGDTNGYYDIFVRDRTTGVTERVSVSTAGVEPLYGCYDSSISSDGRYVVFESGADNLVTGDTNYSDDVFVHDRETGELARVSVNASGDEADEGGRTPAISGNGRCITYVSYAENLVDEDTYYSSDSIFIYNWLSTPVVDTTAPYWPGGGTLSAGNIHDESLTLSWSGAIDNVCVTGYRIYRDDSLLAAVSSNTGTYDVTGLAAGTSYTFTVEAGDAAGNWSAGGPSVTVAIAGPPATITTVAGNQALGRGYSGDGGPATDAQMNRPYAVAVAENGRYYIADDWNNCIRMVDTDGTITTVAGLGGEQNDGFSGDGGPATGAMLYYPHGVAVDSGGNIYIADMQNSRIRMVAGADMSRYGIPMTAGNIYTVAGTGTSGYSGDGSAAVSADINKPFGITLDSSGNLYIADTYNHCIRKVDAGGTITTAAGNGMQGFSGDGGTATAAKLQNPYAVTVDGDGNLFIADATNSRIRMVAASDQTRYGIAMTEGYIYTVAGNGTNGYSGDGGPAIAAQLSYPDGLALDSDGNLYIAESYNNCIRKVDTNGIITTIAGQGPFFPGYTGDGSLAGDAKLNGPRGVTVDSDGNIFIADSGNNVIRKIYAGQPVVVPAVPISDFANTGKTDTTASFSFTAPAGAAAVKIQQSTDSGENWTDSTTSAALTAASTTVTVTGLTQNTAYKFKLVVTGGSHAGDSNVVDVTTEAVVSNNIPTAKSPVPLQSVAVNGTIGYTASDIAEDMDGDILTITGVVTSPATATATANLTGGTVTITGAAAGSTSMKVTVSDGNGGSVEVTVPITVNPVQRPHSPVADAGGPYVIGIIGLEQGQELTLDGSGSYDPDEASADHIVSYEWDINGDGVYDFTGDVTSITWTELESLLQPLQYPADPRTGLPEVTIALKVTDGTGRTNVNTATLTLYNSTPVPVPAWGPQPYVPIKPDGTATVRLDGSASYSGMPAYPVVSWKWELTGDPSKFVTGMMTELTIDLKPLPNPLPPQGIKKTLRLAVTNSLGEIQYYSFDVVFNILPSQPPNIRFDADRRGKFIEQGEGFMVNANLTADPDPGDWVNRLAWDLNNDGTDDIVWTRTDTNNDGQINSIDTGPNYVLHKTWEEMADYPPLQQIGQHYIRLTVTDNNGVAAQDTVLLTVDLKAMIAKGRALPNVGEPGTEINFDGSESRHLFPGQTITAWQWDFDGDGIYDGTGQTAAHTFEALGTYTVTLRVRDAGGHEATDTVTVTVSNADEISESLAVSNPSTTGFTITLNPALAGLTGSDFILKDDQDNAVTITSAETSDEGATYAISAALTAGKTYTVTAVKTGYNFGTAVNVAVPAVPISNFASTGKTDTTATFSFTAPAGATAVKVQQSDNGGETWTDSTTSGALTAASTTATVTGLTQNTAYKFKLVVTGGSHAGDSNVVDVTTEAAVTPLSITTTSLPDGIVGSPYNTTLIASGGTSPHIWSATGLPAGLNIGSGGVISGSPTAAGTTTVFVTVSDSAGHNASASYDLTVGPPEMLSFPVANAGGPYIINMGQSLALDGSGSYDSDETAGDYIVSYEWDIDGDGVYDDAAGENATKSYAQLSALINPFTPADPISGQPKYNVRLKVTDTTGRTGTAQTTLTIYQPKAADLIGLRAKENADGRGRELISRFDGNIYSYTANVTNAVASIRVVPFTASGTSALVKKGQDLYPDGIVALSLGDNTIEVVVQEMGKADKTYTITINRTEEFFLVANAGGPYIISPGESLKLDGLGSYYNILNYEWDIDGDGAYDDAVGAFVTINYDQLTALINPLTPVDPVTGQPKYDIGLKVTSPEGTGMAQTTMTVTTELAISTASLPVGMVYSTTLAAIGGTAPYTWSAAGLPEGLSLNASTGVISGTPTTENPATIAITVRDSIGQSAITSLNVDVLTYLIDYGPVAQGAASPSVVTEGTSGPGNGVVTFSHKDSYHPGGIYKQIIDYQWLFDVPDPQNINWNSYNMGQGGIPDGHYSSDGKAWHGMDPNAKPIYTYYFAGTYHAALRVVDNNVPGKTDIMVVEITVNPSLTITTPSLPSGTIGVPYSTTLAVNDGIAPYTWTAVGMPAGLSINALTGEISGTPAAAGESTVTVSVSDSVGRHSASAILSLTVNSPRISDFASTGKTDTTAGFSFTAPAGATAVKVQQSTDGGETWTDSTAGALTAASTTATVTGLTQNTAYKFKLVVTGGSHEGESNIVDVTTDVTIINESLAVSNPSTTGFTITLNPALAGLTGSDFILKDDQDNAVTITSAETSDEGATYAISAALTAGKTYTVTAVKTGYDFGTAANVAVPAVLSITTASLPYGAAGSSYSITLTAGGGTSPYTWEVAGLPAGLNINESTGVISGTPTAAGTLTVTVMVRDSVGQTDSKTLSLTVNKGVDSLDTWHWRNPLPEGNISNLSRVVFGSGKFVTVGAGGTILTSTDGTNWTIRTSGTTSSLAGVTYSSNKFIAVGAGGIILTSADGITWIGRTSGTTNDLKSIKYGSDRFVAAGAGGTILTSADGITWTGRTSGTTYEIADIAYGGGKFVAVGGSDYSLMLTSSDGVTWTKVSVYNSYPLYGVTYGNSIFAAVGYKGLVLTSPDGAVWTARTPGTGYNDLQGVVYSGSAFMAVGTDGTLMTSADGITWNYASSGTDRDFSGITYGNDNFVAVGDSGMIMTSADGTAWANPSGVTATLSGIAYGNNIFVVIGNQTLLTSPDGRTWTKRPAIPGASRVVYSGNTFLALGGNGIIRTSPDGITWTNRTSGTFENINGASFGSGIFVAAGNKGTIVTSGDSITWTIRTSGTTQNLNSIIYGNGVFTAVGAGGTILTSPDGINWTLRTSGTTDIITDVTYGSGIFAAAAYKIGVHGDVESSSILTSADGITWTIRTPVTVKQLNGLTYRNGLFAAVGQNGTVLTSPDGISWASLTTGTARNLRQIASDGENFVAVGVSGTILQSGPPEGSSDNSSGNSNNSDSSTGSTTGGIINPHTNVNTWLGQDNRPVTTVTIDENRTIDAINNNSANNNSAVSTVIVEVAQSTGVINVEVGGRLLDTLFDSGSSLEIRTPFASFTLPSVELNTEHLLKQLGIESGDIVMNVSVSEPTPEQIRAATEAAEKAGLSMIVTPVEFKVEIVAGDRSINITQFGSYVSRVINLSDPVDPNYVVGVEITADGVIIPLPTTISQQLHENAMAIIQNLRASLYTVIENKKSFADTDGHWAKDDIDILASKLIISGKTQDTFAPDNKITRAEFAVILVRAMGLQANAESTGFSDVQPGDWYAGAIGAAVEAGIIRGYSDGTFRPNAQVTREEAAAMLFQALKAAGVSVNITDAEEDQYLAQLRDGATIDPWAKTAVALAVKYGIINGNPDGSFITAANSTRAESAVMIRKMLIKAEFI